MTVEEALNNHLATVGASMREAQKIALKSSKDEGGVIDKETNTMCAVCGCAVCGTCLYNRYNRREGKDTFSCGNEENDNYGIQTFYDDTCDGWEEKED